MKPSDVKPHYLAPGVRVELSPATDRWMRGDRFGTVEKHGRKWIHLRMDTSGQLVRIPRDNPGDVLYSIAGDVLEA